MTEDALDIIIWLLEHIQAVHPPRPIAATVGRKTMSNLPPYNQGRSLRDTLTQFSLRAAKLEERIRNPQLVVDANDRNHRTDTTWSSSLSPSIASLHWKRRFAELAPALVSLPRPVYDESTETLTGSEGATNGGAAKRRKPDSTTATTCGSSRNAVAEASRSTNDSVNINASNDASNETTTSPAATTNEGATQPEEAEASQMLERSRSHPMRQPLAIDRDIHPDSDRNNTAGSSSLFTRELYYKEQIRKVQEEISQIQNQRTQFQTKQLELWGMYMYGLHKITTIGDLGDAPDAILPGNY
jgi:hypothetical protein